MQTQGVPEKKNLLQLCEVYPVIMFYQKPMNKRRGKTTKKYFEPNFIQLMVHLPLRSQKRTNFLHVRYRVVDSLGLFSAIVLIGFRKQLS